MARTSRRAAPPPPPSPVTEMASAYDGLSLSEIDALLAAYEEGLDTDMTEYRGDPVRYMQERLHLTLTAKQMEVARALAKYQRVIVKASHGVGKTWLVAAYILYVYECYAPSISLSTAPSFEQVVDLLWKQIRVHARDLALPFMPSLPVLTDPLDPMHYAKGLTARTADSFQGRHEERIFLAFDEAVGVRREFWVGAEGMLTGDDASIVAIFNPTDVTSPAYDYDRSTNWHSISMSALDHPNIAAELAGMPPPFPKAVRLSFIDQKVSDTKWCTPLAQTDRKLATDFEWPPGSGTWYRPGPLMESKVLGRWPTRSVTSVWSDAAWEASCATRHEERADLITQLGCDVARYGDDQTTMHARRGACSLHHESHGGMNVVEVAARLKALAAEQARRIGTEARALPIAVDDTGVGGGVTDILATDGYNVLPINMLESALDPEMYPNRRSELWFTMADRAMEGRLDVTRLGDEARDEIRRQIMAPKWRQDSAGRRVVEDKSKTKGRLGRSPDDADSFNLAFASAGGMALASTAGPTPVALRSRGGTWPPPALAGGGPGSAPTPAGPTPPQAVPARLVRTDDEDEGARSQQVAAGGSAPGEADPWLTAAGKGHGDPRLALLALMGYRTEGVH